MNLAFGSRRTLLKVIEELESLLGHELSREHRVPRAGDVRHSQASDARLAALLPHVKAVPFAEGLEATLAWFRDAFRDADG